MDEPSRYFPEPLRGEELYEKLRKFDDALAAESAKGFKCRICESYLGEKVYFGEPVWHCPKCEHHWPSSYTDCLNCYQGSDPNSGPN